MPKTYTTELGDMWDSVAFKALGDVAYMDRIMNLNQLYREYFIFPPGLTLTLPESEPDVSANLPPWFKT